MKNIFEGQVLNALPIAGGIVFAYVEKITANHLTNATKKFNELKKK